MCGSLGEQNRDDNPAPGPTRARGDRNSRNVRPWEDAGVADLISIAEARERVLAAVQPLPAEEVPLDRALGRVLAAEVRSDEDLPPFDSSAMDCYAVVAGPEG